MDLNSVLGRTHIYTQIQNIVMSYRDIPLSEKRGIYVYGESGIGKTIFVKELLTALGHDIVPYDSDCVRNTGLVESFSNLNSSGTNIMQNFKRQQCKMTIVLDDMESMSIGDKPSINALVKLLRPKKTKKQKQEPRAITPIICIGTSITHDKSIRELATVCYTFEIPPPTPSQMSSLVTHMFPTSTHKHNEIICEYVNTDVSKLFHLANLYNIDELDIMVKNISTAFVGKNNHYSTKIKTHMLLTTPSNITSNTVMLPDAERTIVNKLWHENVVDTFKGSELQMLPKYIQMLRNICYADYIDRLTFQKQIWQLNELSSLVKTFHNCHILHQSPIVSYILPEDIRFTKILTKYSTEYNNFLFVRNICQTLNTEKKDLIGFLHDHQHLPDDRRHLIFNSYETMDKYTVSRLYKYASKYSAPTNIDTLYVSNNTTIIDGSSIDDPCDEHIHVI